MLLVAFLFVKFGGADLIGDSGMPKKKKKGAVRMTPTQLRRCLPSRRWEGTTDDDDS